LGTCFESLSTVFSWVCGKASDLFEEGLPRDFITILLGPYELLVEDLACQTPPAVAFPEEESQLIPAPAAECEDRAAECGICIGGHGTSGEHVDSPPEVRVAHPDEEPLGFQGMDEWPI
jgi:hypothetical protein